MSYWQSTDFKALQKAWYERLENEGFADAETLVDGDMVLKDAAPQHHERVERNFHERDSYFNVIQQLIVDTAFDRESDRIILTMHADGANYSEILDALRLQGPRYPPRFRSPLMRCRRCRNTIWWTIRRYEMRWGLRKYTRRQLGDYRRGA